MTRSTCAPSSTFTWPGRPGSSAAAERERSAHFGFGKWKGWRYLRRQLIHDVDALNRVELLPWDLFGELMTRSERDVERRGPRPAGPPGRADARRRRRLDEMRETYEAMPYSRVVQSKLRLLGLDGELQVADPARLRPSDGGAAPAEQAAAASQPARRVRAVHESRWEPSDRPAGAASGRRRSAGLGDIHIHGARQHNLKNIDVDHPPLQAGGHDRGQRQRQVEPGL